MKVIYTKSVALAVKKLCLEAGINIDQPVLEALKEARQKEDGEKARFALDIMIKNAHIAKDQAIPLCQDTGMTIVFVEMGQDVHIEGGLLEDAINQGIREAFCQGRFRKSVREPISGQNTKDNTPAVVHYQITEGDKLKLHVMLKGFGSENMSRLFMLTPAQGLEGIKEAVITAAKEAGGNPCPPIVLGVGIGGTMEKAAILSKKALLRDFNSPNKDSFLNRLEKELEDSINALNIGPQGFGGKTSVLKVFIETFPTHIAGLPVAVTVQCHAVRHGSVIL